MRLRTLAILASLLLFVSCAPIRPALKELPVPPQRSEHKGFSLVPLNEAGWLIGFQQSSVLMLGKRGTDPDENFAIRAFTVLLPDFKSHDEFMGFARTAIHENDPIRFKPLLEEAKTVTVRGQSCGRTKTLTEDHGAVKRTKRSDFMLLEAHSLVCPHPQKKMAVIVAYSHRYYPGNADSETARKADRIFETVEFADF